MHSHGMGGGSVILPIAFQAVDAAEVASLEKELESVRKKAASVELPREKAKHSPREITSSILHVHKPLKDIRPEQHADKQAHSYVDASVTYEAKAHPLHEIVYKPVPGKISNRHLAASGYANTDSRYVHPLWLVLYHQSQLATGFVL